MKLTKLQESVLFLNQRGKRQKEIAAILNIRQSSVSRCVESLERKGYEIDRFWRPGKTKLPSLSELKQKYGNNPSEPHIIDSDDSPNT